jgi:hypothetical protein
VLKKERMIYFFAVMSLDHTPSSIMNSIAEGACAFWSKPLDKNQFKTMWQHVVRNTLSESQLHVLRKALSESHELPQTSEVKGHKKRGREDVDVPKPPLAKKSRLSWTPELNEQFLSAVNQLGVNSMNLSMLFFFVCCLFVFVKNSIMIIDLCACFSSLFFRCSAERNSETDEFSRFDIRACS